MATNSALSELELSLDPKHSLDGRPKLGSHFIVRVLLRGMACDLSHEGILGFRRCYPSALQRGIQPLTSVFVDHLHRRTQQRIGT